MSNYYRIYFGDDHVSVENLTKEEVIEAINGEDEDPFSDKMSAELEKGKSIGWPEDCECYQSVIIKGEIVIPKAIEKVTKYEID